ncbi:hypothetical protein E1A91_D04G070400v1 [Gossypium mustelinum]|uniref:Uncharacterized protein n=2 Tax=Gossypium TaxID=3633 RepID=A0A5D2VB21_GOSMU|nr:hypothetical protein ES288_D04G072300v1 [Gossypium darwinii]TYI86528.1 hypothetical protein E1A91_D04G070400v1 [Gossypium mustelinum]TYI86529.1 hypothetical protein E1A91_D04G070400v1 [Gossypium mustelinum]
MLAIASTAKTEGCVKIDFYERGLRWLPTLRLHTLNRPYEHSTLVIGVMLKEPGHSRSAWILVSTPPAHLGQRLELVTIL